MYLHNDKLLDFSQNLRKNMTPQEKHLWYDFLKRLPLTVKRQKIVNGYILDFYISSAHIAIELDGSQHHTPKNLETDKKRDDDLLLKGIKVLRYSNLDIDNDFYAVCKNILSELGLNEGDLL